jgi:hypothetical protein
MGSTNTIIRSITQKKVKVGGASKKGRQHVAHARKYQRQTIRTAKNKEKSWKLHLRKHPNDEVAKENIQRLMGD